MVLILEQANQLARDLKKDITELGNAIQIEKLKNELSTLEEQTQQSDFWLDSNRSQTIMAVLKDKKSVYDSYIELCELMKSTEELIELAPDTDDDSLSADIMADVKRMQNMYEHQRTRLLLSGEYDKLNAILSIHPGAGGTEAQDWAEMLYRMYMRFAERDGFKFKMLDYLDGDEAGIKSATFSVEGEYAYGYLKGEAGVHRLVRVSPFDASGRRHTSFASVEVTPEFTDALKIEIRDEDLKIEAHRASGAGGQHINKTDSAIRIIHIPSGIVVGCQNERSQLQNKEVAMKMLKSKLLEIKKRENYEKIDDIKGVKLNIEWGAQIRSYVFMPYTLVKDHRTNYEDGDINKIMDGDLDGFINAYLKHNTETN
ncbi:Peptide chain release factor 2 [bioreactor metagenome]|uniref:Peptide chain release factor 2 n=1 Tax=bioreactor metagenome TaxID=1076179 RepID=A0A645DN53_9ZZZZ